MKTTIDLPETLVRNLKLQAIHDRKTLQMLATELLRAAAMPPSSRAQSELAPKKLPVIIARTTGHRVKLPLIVAPPGAPKFILTGEEIDRQLTEDEVKSDHEPAGKPSPKTRRGKMTLPFFPCAPDAPARHMSIGQLLALEQESQNQEDRARLGLSH